MPDERGLAIAEGIAGGINQGVMNLLNVMEARNKWRQDKELFDIQKKKANLDLKELEFTTSPEMFEFRKGEVKAKTLAFENKQKLDDANLTKVEAGARKALDEEKQVASQKFLAGFSGETAEGTFFEGGAGIDGGEQFSDAQIAEEARQQFSVTRGQAGRKALGLESEVKPSFGQQQKIAAMRSGLARGKVVIGKEWGEPTIYEPKTMDEAVSVITEANLDPALFREELARFEETIVQDNRGRKFTVPQYQLEEALNSGYTQVEKIIEDENAKRGAATGDIALPSEIKTTSQAVKWLTENQGLSEEEAKDWIRNQ